MRTGTVYTETVIYSAAEAFAGDVPFQTAIVTLDDGRSRVTARITGERVSIADHVVEVEPRGGVPFFQRVADGGQKPGGRPEGLTPHS
jgi:uncharacterized OB-fold protein